MREITLQSKVNRILAVTLIVVAAIGLVSGLTYTHLRVMWAKNRVSEDLQRDLPNQIESVIPSFLLPEQSAGLFLILDRIKNNEKLSSIEVVKTSDELQKKFPDCANLSASLVCFNDDSKTIVAKPIEESGHLFGYLVKTKTNDITESSGQLIETIEAVGIALFISFAVLFWVLAKLMSKEVPRSLDDLLKWIEADLNGHPQKIPHLKFKEFNQLREGISEILERYDRSRDQAVIGQLTSGIMHDIKTSLSSIVMASGLVNEQSEGSAKRLTRLEHLQKVCTTRLPMIGAIIETTLDGSRDIHIEPRFANLGNAIHDALAINSDLIQLHKAKIDVEVPDSAIEHDPVQVTRVFTNLIKNGIEAAHEKGAQPAIRIKLESTTDSVQVVFEDNGPGLPEKSESLFRIFKSTKAHGCGLGLTVSRKIVEAHRGSITVTRSLDLGGAQFNLRFPHHVLVETVNIGGLV